MYIVINITSILFTKSFVLSGWGFVKWVFYFKRLMKFITSPPNLEVYCC